MKAAIYFAEGYEEVEALSVVDVLRRGGVEVIMVGVSEKQVIGAHQIKIEMDRLMDQVALDDIEMMILPGGGLGVENLKKNEALIEALKDFKAQGKWLAAICAGPSVLGQAGLLQGEEAICYPGFEAQLLGATISEARVAVSGKIVTAIGAGAALDFGFKLLEVLKGKETADKVRRAMLA